MQFAGQTHTLINTTAWYCIRSYPIRMECVVLPKLDSLLHFVLLRNDTGFLASEEREERFAKAKRSSLSPR